MCRKSSTHDPNASNSEGCASAVKRILGKVEGKNGQLRCG